MLFVTVREFRDKATQVLRQKEPVLVTRDGKPAGFFIPWEQSSMQDDIRKAVLEALAESLRAHRKKQDLTEEEVLDDFAAYRKARRGR